MARLSNRAKILRLRGQGFSDRDIANVTGVSVSAVGRARRGQTSGDTFGAALGEFFGLTKRAKQNVISGEVSLPSAKPAREVKAKPSIIERFGVTPLERAAGQLVVQDSDAALVVQVTMRGTGKSRTLFAHGGTSKAHLMSNLRGVISSQYRSQYRGDSIDWDDVISIDIQEY